jgi:hypothetical protein
MGFSSAAAPPSPASGKPRIFILSGQSNMTCRGGLGDLRNPAEDLKATLVRYIMAPEDVEKYNETIHWHANGESYWLVGEAMGREMVKLLQQGK